MVRCSTSRIYLGDFIFKAVLLHCMSKDSFGHGRTANVAYENAHAALSTIPFAFPVWLWYQCLPKHTNKTLIGSLDIFLSAAVV